MTDERELTAVTGPVTGGPLEPYPLLKRAEMDNILALLDDNLNPQTFSILTLPRIRVGAGGGLNWRVETAGGEASVKELEGLIVAWRPARIFWQSKFGSRGGRKPPDCTSTDGFLGVGDPGGSCTDCPYARFGSAINADGTKGSGQACKEVRQLLIVLPDEIIPHMLSVPPTSVKAFTQYCLQLVSSTRSPYWAATTKLTLERANNEAGIDYAKVVYRVGRRLSPEHQRVLYPYHQKMKEILVPSVVDTTAYEVFDEEAPPPPPPSAFEQF